MILTACPRVNGGELSETGGRLEEALSQALAIKDGGRSAAVPLLWTTGWMAPEACTLEAALDRWIANENVTRIRERAALAYVTSINMAGSARHSGCL
jgi:hypothetical protein